MTDMINDINVSHIRKIADLLKCKDIIEKEQVKMANKKERLYDKPDDCKTDYEKNEYNYLLGANSFYEKCLMSINNSVEAIYHEIYDEYMTEEKRQLDALMKAMSDNPDYANLPF